MDAVDKKILNNIFSLLDRLNLQMKLSLIDLLSESVKTRSSSKSKMKTAFGAWESDESAEDLIETIRTSRNTNRQIEQF